MSVNTALSAFGNNYIETKVVNNIHNETAFLAYLELKKKIHKRSGGNSITRPILYKAGSNSKDFAGSEDISNVEDDCFTNCTQEWKQKKTGLLISKLDMNKNGSPEGKVNLIMERSDLMKSDMAELLSVNIFGSGGTGTASPKMFDGLGTIINATSTFGGLSIADVPAWAAQVKGNGGTARPIGLPLLQEMYGACSFAKMSPFLMVARQAQWDKIWGLYSAFQRLGSEELGKLGFTSILFNGKPIIVDEHVATTNEVLFIGDDYRIDAMAADYYQLTSISELENSDCLSKRITFTGNSTIACRRLHGQLTDLA
jgi:hypothetical protein